MNKKTVIEKIRQVKVMPVVRAESENQVTAVVEALLKGGINVLEITMTIPNAVQVIKGLSERLGNSALIGAGTVLDAEIAQRCFEAGAQFIVSPLTDFSTIEFCRKNEIAVFPGAMTVTEIHAAWNAGADAVKVFPASALGGAGYLKAVKTVLPNIELIPTGGVNLTTVADFMRAGAIAVGVGGELVDVQAVRSGKPDIIVEQARKFVDAVKNV